VPRLAALLLLLAACHGGMPPGDPAAQPGISQRTLPLGDGHELRYTLLIPDQGPQPRPLILALHYGGEVTPFYGRGILELLVAPALAELRAVIVAPDALERGWTTELNERAVLALLDHLTRTLPIDRTRVVCTGYSMGGTGTWFLAGRHPDLFSAAIPIAARPVPTEKWQVPVYVIHGRNDQVMPLAPAEQQVAALKAAGADAQLMVVDGATHFQTDRFVAPLRAAAPWVREVWSRRH
jgi:predicted peptidase